MLPILAGLLLLSLLLPFGALRTPILLAALLHLALWFRGMIAPRSRIFGPVTWRIPTTCPVVFLTFDDGPTPGATDRILEILEPLGARATFFPIGRRLALHPAQGRRIQRKGHTFGSHSWSHPALMVLSPPSRIAREIEAGQSILRQITGRRSRWFRPPAGLRSPWLFREADRAGLRLISWTARGLECPTSSPESIRRRLLKRVRPGAILLLHDGPNPERARASVAALPELLGALLRRGYRIEALPESNSLSNLGI